MDKKTANKNQELGDIKTFLENLIEPLSNTIGDDYECKLLNETAFGHNIEYVLNVEHTESGKHKEIPLNNFYEKISTYKMTREEAFMYIVIFTLSDIERNKKAEALYKNAIKKYDKLKTDEESDFGYAQFFEQSDRRLRGQIGRDNFDNVNIDYDIDNLQYDLDDMLCVEDERNEMHFNHAKPIGQFQDFPAVDYTDDIDNKECEDDFDEFTMNNMSNEEYESYDIVSNIKYNMMKQLGNSYVCKIKFVEDIPDFEQEDGSDFKKRIFAIEVLKNNKFVTVIDAEKLYEDIVYDDMSMPEAAARLIEEIYNAE